MTNTQFDKVKAEHMERLEQYVPVVARVHGKNHPEFSEMHQLFNQLNEKIKATETENVDLNKEFKQLRKVTNRYEVPDDVCESTEAVFNMLEDLDQAYSAE